MKRSHTVLVTGIGAVAPGCDSRAKLWELVTTGESRLTLSPDPTDPSRKVAMGRLGPAEVLLERLPAFVRERWTREQQLHLASLLLARQDAALVDARVPVDRVGIFDGTSRANLGYLCERLEPEPGQGREPFTARDLAVGLPNHAAALAAVHLGVRGPACTYSATCASGAVAIGHALRAVERGDVDVAFASGHDIALLRPIYEMYGDAGLVSREQVASRAIRPFAQSSGTAFGEGSITLVLESEEHAAARNAQALAVLTDSAHGNNGMHAMNVDTTGEMPARLIRRLLAANGVAPDDVGFVIGHGNGSPAVYDCESAVMRRVFGDALRDTPLLSTKPIFGHLMAAASALDVATAVLAVHHGRVFSTLNADEDPARNELRHGGGALEGGRRRGVTMTFGMGGHVAVMLVESVNPSRRDAPSGRDGRWR